jgi:hypothetical protein
VKTARNENANTRHGNGVSAPDVSGLQEGADEGGADESAAHSLSPDSGAAAVPGVFVGQPLDFCAGV